jgi:hypothetical protein
MVVDTVREGELFMPFHYGQGDEAANQHTWYARDPVSQQPQLKSSPVAIRRLSFGAAEDWLLQRLAELDGGIIEPFAARRYGAHEDPTPPLAGIEAPPTAPERTREEVDASADEPA